MKIKENIIDSVTLEGSIDNVIRELKNIQNYYSKKYDDIVIQIDSGHENYIVKLEGERQETAEEKKKRLSIDINEKEEVIAKKQRQLLRLAKELNAKVEM